MQITPIVKNLLIINVLIWVAIMLLTYDGMPSSVSSVVNNIDNNFLTLHKSNLLGFREVVPVSGGGEGYPVGGRYYSPANNFNILQLVGHFFNHHRGSMGHLFFNMLALFFIGPLIEMTMKARSFLQYYLFCGIVGGIFVAFLDPSANPVVGASGALSGLLVALALYFPNLRMSLMFLFPMKATTLAWGLGIVSAAFVLLELVNPGGGTGGGISHFGHLSGMLAAVIFFYVRPYVPFLR